MNNYYEESQQTWNTLADAYEAKFMHIDLYHTSYDAFLAHLPQQATVIDIGSGPGNVAFYLVSKRPDLQLTCVDTSPAMLKIVKRYIPQASTYMLDARHISTLEQQYHGIIMGFCLPYIAPEDVVHVFAAAYQLLSSQGIFYLSFVPGEQHQSGYQTGSTGDRLYFYYHPLSKLQTELNEVGFQIIGTMCIDYPKVNKETEVHHVLLAKKV